MSSLLDRKIEKRPDKVRLKGRILFLTEDPELIKRQLAGWDMPWDTNSPANNPKLRDDITVAIANFRKVTETASRATENIERFSGNLQKVSDEASSTLADARSALAKSQAALPFYTPKEKRDELKYVRAGLQEILGILKPRR